MTTPGYSRAEASGAGAREPSSIIGVDPQTRIATALLRSRYTVRVNCSFAVGDSIITPALGEQWYVERFDMEWRLAGRIPFNDATLNIEAKPGQVSVGSANGPLELNGDLVNLRSPITLHAVATADRPDAVVAGAGATIYDTDLHKPLHSDGAVWRDAMANAV